MVSGLLTGVMVGGMRHGSGSVLLAKPHTHTHIDVLSDYSAALLESHNQQTHLVTLAFHTRPHTTLKKTNYFGNLRFVWISGMIVKQDLWVSHK